MNAQRRLKERAAREAMQPEGAPATADEELLRQLDAELNRLPEKYRIPIVLCELEGRSRKEVARLLGLAEGTLSWRLAHARKLLAQRLSRRGMVLAAGVLPLAGEAASASVSATLRLATTQAAVQLAAGRALTAGVVSAQVMSLTEGVLKTMFLNKLKSIWVAALVVVLGAGATGLSYRAMGQQPAAAREAPLRTRVVLDEVEALRLEVEALRKGLQVTRERVKALEGDVQALQQMRALGSSSSGGLTGLGGLNSGGLGGFNGGLAGFSGGLGGGMMGLSGDNARGLMGNSLSTGSLSGTSTNASRPRPEKLLGQGSQPKSAKPNAPMDPLGEVEKALQEYRKHPNDLQAKERLGHALKRLDDALKR
jgi:hypothetical protein